MIDDFIRNFYVKMGLTRTAEIFEAEWYELKATGRLEGANTTVPDIYLRNGVSGASTTLAGVQLALIPGTARLAALLVHAFSLYRIIQVIHHHS